jgi:hypothetical protein
MVLHFWRRWFDDNLSTTQAKRRVDGSAARSSRPLLEQLEARWLPAPLIGPLLGAHAGAALGSAGHVGQARPGSAAGIQVDVTVPRNSGDSVYDLSQVLAGWEGWGYQVPPRISVVGNTNRGLVTTRLTDTELRLTFTPGQSGTARVTVALTDAAGVSTQITFVITVLPGPVARVAQLGSLKLPSTGSPLAD